MEKTVKVEPANPALFPHGWKTEVASILDIHPNTVKNALNRGLRNPKDETYLQIMKCAQEKYGKPINN